MGDPATELVRVAEAEHVDLIAMSTHGHRFLNDISAAAPPIASATTCVPVLMIRAVSGKQ